MSAKTFVASVIINLIVMQAVFAQRPPFAGVRPPNGGTQKDKYLTSTAASSTGEIQNRFGGSDTPVSVPIPFGQTQKPPVGIVVTPESNFVKLETATNEVAFQDRFGAADANPIPVSPTVTTVAPPPGHPFDAHGDQQLIDYLSTLPVDKQPFWFINYKAIEAQRNGTLTNFAGAQAARGSFFG